MGQRRLRATFMRGGTSKAVMFHERDLPADRATWDAIFLSIMGSPDPNGRQLDGMGGGISSLSKVCIIGPPSRPDADVDYTFAQVSVTDARVDYSGNCGNMSSAIGPFAADEGLVPAPRDGDATVRIHNTNTNKIIVSRFGMEGGEAAVDGVLEIDGLSGAGAPIRLDFTAPEGSKTGKLLPTDNAIDTIEVSGIGAVTASLIDAANPCVFVAAEALGMTGTERPDRLEGDAVLLDRLETIRRRASVMMGLAPDEDAAGRLPSVPKIALVTAPVDSVTLSGRHLGAAEIDILIRMISIGQPHRAVPLTGALCLAVACRVPGSLPNRLASADGEGDIRIGHPSGVVLVSAEVRQAGNALEVPYASVYRTARRLFQGEVLHRAGSAV